MEIVAVRSCCAGKILQTQRGCPDLGREVSRNLPRMFHASSFARDFDSSMKACNNGVTCPCHSAAILIGAKPGNGSARTPAGSAFLGIAPDKPMPSPLDT